MSELSIPILDLSPEIELLWEDLNGAVQRVPVGASQPAPAEDGANLQAGDRILTGANDRALVTFLDETPAQLIGSR